MEQGVTDLDLSDLDSDADAETSGPETSGEGAAAGRREEVRIPLPNGFDPAKHQSFLLQKLAGAARCPAGSWT